jgi:hypothetical protein
MKIALHLVLLVILAFGWGHFLQSRSQMAQTVELAQAASIVGDFDSSDRLANAAEAQEGRMVLTGILLAFLSAGYVGIVFVAYLLPVLANKLTYAMFESGESGGPDALRHARALVAQGNYADAVEAFRRVAATEEGNRLPWLEIARLQREHLDDSLGAAATLREALEGHPWGEDDAGFLMFRLADLYADAFHDQDAAAEILAQLIQNFPQTRHSANARHRLQQWGRGFASP